MVDIASLLTDLIQWNTGFWGTLIGFFDSAIASYGWTIILFTLIIKLILSPFDFLQRRAAAKQSKIQMKVAPELNKIKQKYANDPQKMREKMNEKQAELMRSGEMKMGSTCLVMALNMILTLVVFLTLFTSMTSIANIRTVNTYISLENEYKTSLESGKTQEEAQNAVLKLYNSGEVTESWLWIDNLWKPDTAVNPVASFKEFQKVAKSVKKNPYKFEGEGALTEEYYNQVMGKVINEKKDNWNGYYILIILCGLISFLSMHFASGQGFSRKKKKDKVAPVTPNSMNFMKWIMPAIMVLITLFYSSAFALYIFANSLFMLIVTPLFNLIFKKMDNKKDNKNNGNSSNLGSKDESINVDYRIKKITKIDD